MPGRPGGSRALTDPRNDPMNSPSHNPNPPATIIVEALAAEGRDAAAVRSQKLSLLAQLGSGSAGSGGLRPEDLLAQWPTNPATDRDAASLIFQDFCRQRAQDPATSLQEYEARFPEHRDSLAS